MTPSRARRALSCLLLLLGTATALGLAGCANVDGKADNKPAGTVQSLSDLPDKGRSLLKVGDVSREAGDCAAAIRFYRLALEKEKKPAEIVAARVGAGECSLSMGALPDAERDFIAARKLAPRDPGPLVGLGRVYLIEHKPGEAASYFDLAVKQGASAAFVWNDKGVALDQLHRHAEAQQAYRTGLTGYPNDRALRNNLGLSLAMSRDFREAETILRTLASEPDATPRARQNLALVLGLEGDDAGARRVAEADLDGAALDNNERFYAYVRAMMTGAAPPASIPVPVAAITVPPPRSRIARAGIDALPAPAWVERPTGLKLRAPTPENFAVMPEDRQTSSTAMTQSAAAEPAPTALVPAEAEPMAAPVATSE
jgi:Flp pilus assembly protein TadD